MNAFSLVIKNGTLIDPERRRMAVGNLGIRDGLIAVITREKIYGEKEIDAGLSVVCPGFVDIHAHVDGYLYSAQCMAKQGVTTTTGGNCGISPVDMDAFFNRCDEQGLPLNQAMMIGHSFALREKVGVKSPYRPATMEQLEGMIYLTEKAFDAGAAGLSFGLEYAPGSSFEEVLALSRVAVRYGKLMSVHLRADSWGGIPAILEVLKVSRLCGVPVQISHLTYQVGMGMMTQALEILDEAIRDGVDVTADSGLYSAFATHIGSTVFEKGCVEKWDCDYGDLYVATGEYAGQRCSKSLYEKLRSKHKEELVVAFVGKESEVYEALLPEYVMVSSDGGIGSPKPGTGHPQDAGTFPRLFERAVRKYERITLMDAIRKSTYIPAERLGLKNKGRLKEGADADIVIFNPNRIEDRADYLGFGKPDEPPIGIEHVIVNGIHVVENGRLKEGLKPGKAIRYSNRICTSFF